jgi:MFS family permease
MKKFLESSRIFYGWYIVASSFIILFFNSGARYAFGVMFKPIIKEFGWSRGTLSLVFFLNMIVFALTLAIIGRLYDRYGPKWVILISTLFISTGFVLTSRIQSMGEFFFSYGVLAAIGVAGTGGPLMATLTSKWFEKYRGLALSLSLSGGSVGQFVLVPCVSIVTVTYGWRASYLAFGILMLLVNLVLTFLVIRGDPYHLGMRPLGQTATNEKGGMAKVVSGMGPQPEGLGVRQALRTRSYWLFLGLMFICGGGDYVATTHLIPLATDYGISPLTAGNILGWYGLASLAGILIVGPVADWIGNKTPMVLTFVLRFLLYLLLLKYKSVSSLYVFALLFGFTHLLTAPLTPMLVVKLYGTTHLGILTGLVNTAHFLGGGFWAYLAGVMFDRTGSYQVVFALLAVMAVVAALFSAFIVEKRHESPC